MPNTGTPRSNTPGFSCGAPSAYTLAGPPHRTMACGSLALISSTLAVCGMTSENTLASRTRRAINCAYCAPKSTTSTGRGGCCCTCSVYGRPSRTLEARQDLEQISTTNFVTWIRTILQHFYVASSMTEKVMDWDDANSGAGTFNGPPPWNIGEPQPELAGLITEGKFRGVVLDA